MASRIDVPSPSVVDDITKTSKAFSSESTSGRKPVSSTCFSSPRWWICASSSPRSSPSPAITNRTSGNWRSDERGGLHQVPLALVGHERTDVADDGRAVRQPELRVQVCPGCRVDVTEVDALVDRHEAFGLEAVALRRCAGSRPTRR